MLTAPPGEKSCERACVTDTKQRKDDSGAPTCALGGASAPGEAGVGVGGEVVLLREKRMDPLPPSNQPMAIF